MTDKYSAEVAVMAARLLGPADPELGCDECGDSASAAGDQDGLARIELERGQFANERAGNTVDANPPITLVTGFGESVVHEDFVSQLGRDRFA